MGATEAIDRASPIDVVAVARADQRHESVVVETATAADADRWDAFVAHAPDAVGYHEWAWRRVFENAFGHTCRYLTARRGGAIRAVLPLVEIDSLLFGRTLTSLPFVNYGGVVSADDDASKALIEAAAQLARERRCRHVELRHVERRFQELPCREHKVTMLLGVEDADWGRLDKKVRNQIRKAEKSNLTVESGGAELVAPFYDVFARNMRDLGTPVYSRALFEVVMRTFPTRARLHVVRLDRTPVAAGLTFRTAHRLELPWASSVRDYNALCPNHLLYWQVIQTAAGTGCTLIDFGRSTAGEGTYKFKEQWGAQPVPLHWEYPWLRGGALPNLQPDNPRYALATAVWSHLPVGLATRLGPRIVRGIP